MNNLTTVNQGQQTRTFTYSSLSRLLSANNPESGLISYGYDNGGNLTSKTDARGITTSYVYDNISRVTQRSYSDNVTPTVSYTYDDSAVPYSKGQLTKVSSAVSETKYQAFDIMGRLLQSQQITGGTAYNPMTYTYNLSGAMIEQTYPSGRKVKNVLDNDGQLALVQSKKNGNAGYVNYANSFTYTAAGAVGSMQLGNGKWESTTFNSRLQPTQIALGTVQNGTNKLKLNFDYGTTNNNGNVLSQTITVPNTNAATGFMAIQTYNYDELNRLKSAEEKIANVTSWKQTYTFDRYGNRRFDEANTDTLASGCATAVCNPTIDPATNKLVGYTFDNAGNTEIDANGRTFTYDAENKQILVKDSTLNTVGEYFYDGDGKRIKKIAGSEETIFVYNANGQLVAEYSNQISQTPKVSYLTSDHLGSPRITTDADGDVYTRRDFMPFGEEIDVGDTPKRTATLNYANDEIREKFATYERDNETDLDFAQARMYAKNLGQYLSVDPIKFKNNRAFDPQRINLFAYVRNNPFKFIDPDGEDVNLVNKTEERRDKALQSIKVNMTEDEASNVDVRFNEKKSKFEVYIKDSKAVDLSKASKGYSDLVNRINNKDLQLDFTLLGKNETVSTDLGKVSHIDLISPNGIAGGGFVQVQSDGTYAVVVAEGGYPAGVEGIFRVCKSTRTTNVPFPDFIITAHELFGETYKYTPEGKQKGLVNDPVKDSEYVIESENQYRDFHYMPRRTGRDHFLSVEIID